MEANWLNRAQPYLIASIFLSAGLAHFKWPDVYAKTIPDVFPAHRELVAISGVAEMLGGVGMVFPATRPAAAWGLVALLVAVFPANVNMALKSDSYARLAPAWALWARLPLQFLLIAWVLRAGRPSR